MDSSPAFVSADRRRFADHLWRAATLCLGLMPLAMVVADRSSPLVISLAAAAALAATAVEGRTRNLLDDAARRLWTPLGAAVLCFFAWATLSVVWSPVKT